MRPIPSRALAVLPFGAALLLSTAASAAMKPYQVRDCGEHQARIEAAIDDAVEKVRGPLRTLSPEKSAKVLRLLNRRKVEFVCSGETAGHGGKTEFTTDGFATITLTMRSGQGQYPFSQRIFHELLHGIDPQGRLIVTAKVHARSGFPDPVYGCQLAAYRTVWFSDGARTILNYEGANNLVIPEKPGYSCEGIESGDDCKALKKYAHICGTERPFVSRTIVNAAKRRQLPSCVFESLVNLCEERPCVRLRAGVEEDIRMVSSYGGNGISGRMRAACRELGERLAAAFDAGSASGLNADERPLFRIARRRRYFQSCLE